MKTTKKELEDRIKNLEANMLSIMWAGTHLWGEGYPFTYNQHLIREEIKRNKLSKGRKK